MEPMDLVMEEIILAIITATTIIIMDMVTMVTATMELEVVIREMEMVATSMVMDMDPLLAR